MDLKSYLELNKIKVEEFADLVGVPRGTISRYCTGSRTPTGKMMAKIVKATGGQVTPNDFFDLDSEDAA